MCLTLPSFALDSTVSYVNINDRAYQDVEIVITDKSEILVPFKQLADLFDIKYQANRVDKKISFTTFDGKQGMVTQLGVFVDDEPISKRQPIFIMQGIMDGVFNEAYIPASVIEKVMGVTLVTDFESLTLEATVSRDIPILHADETLMQDSGPRAYQDVIAPKKAGKITLKTIGLRDDALADRMSVRPYHRTSTVNTTFTNTAQLSINGDLAGGKYRVEATQYNYKHNGFMFGGLTASYRNKFTFGDGGREFFYELGKVRGIIDEDAQMGTQIFGAQIWNYDNEKPNPRDICGYVKPTSLVRMTANDLEPVTLSTYAGYYSLKEVQLPNPVRRIKLEEINEDGTVELISDERYSIFNRETPLAKEQRATAYAGVWGYQNRLFRDGRNIYRGNNRKATAGAEYQYGISDNVTFKSKASADKIYEKVTSNLVYKVPTNDTLLVSGTQKSVNYLEGATSLNTIEWKNPNNPAIKARAIAGVSYAHDIREHSSHAGYMGKLVGEYDQNISQFKKGIFQPRRLQAKVEAFQTSPDWYIASTDSTSKNDRTGGKVSGGFSFNSTSANGTYSRYYSNMNDKYKGGTLTFDEAGCSASTKIPKVVDLRFHSFYRHGENDLGRNKNYNYDANASRDLWTGAKIQTGFRRSYYDTRYIHPTVENRNYHSKHDDLYSDFTTPLPHNLGKALIGHNIVRYDSGTYKDGYNMIRFGYTFPTWKRITLSLLYGMRYHGQGGNDASATLSYRAKSGQSISIGYQWTQNGGYFIDNMFMPTTNRHAINFTFNDAFQVFNHGFKSVGDEDMHRGLFEAIAFVDVNNDGKYTKNVDVPIQDVPLITSWSGETNVTNKKGRVTSSSLDEGVYTVTINMNDLPITVAPISNDKIVNRIKIDGGQTTRLEIPLLSTVGSVSGVLKITDDFERDFKITDFVVVLLNASGEEVNYSTVTESGEFYISGLAPGKYTLRLDERYISAYGLEEGQNSVIDIVIPYDYYNPTDITDQHLEYRTMAL